MSLFVLGLIVGAMIGGSTAGLAVALIIAESDRRVASEFKVEAQP